jgi:hypothetical protein
VQKSFHLSVGYFASGFDMEIKIFDGATAKSRRLKRSVVAVSSHCFIDLKFNVGAPPSSADQHCCSFKAEIHGNVIQNIKTKFH